MNNKICFIIPYFGKFNNYFPLFLKSCEWNKDYNWLIFTDDKTKYNYPNNVKVVYLSFNELKAKIQSKFDFKIALERPYKLCDLKPMYGYLFEEYLSNYKYWGHCDVDTIMGNLSKWLTDNLLEQYDKLFQLGHMTIYRNTQENNRIFMRKHRGFFPYKEILSTPQNCWFDEEWNNPSNINRIFIDYGRNVFKEDLSLNISFSYNRFVRGKFVGVENTDMPFGFEIEKLKDALYLWDNGNLYRLYMKDGKLVREDFLYMHLQNRKMLLHKEVVDLDIFKIVNDEFQPLGYSYIGCTNFKYIKKTGRCWLVQRLFIKRVKNKIRRTLGIK